MTRLWVLACALAFLAPALAPWTGRVGDPSGGEAFQETRNDSYCLICHGNRTLQRQLGDGRRLSLYVDARVLRDSAHGLFTCLTCHDNREDCPRGEARAGNSTRYQARVADICLGCHLAAAGDYFGSVHGEPILANSGNGATCNDCHSNEGSGHSTDRMTGSQELFSAVAALETCGSCHQEELDSFDRSSHGQLVRYRDEARGATCVSCHGDHAVLGVDDPNRPLSPATLSEICDGCHEDAGEEFAAEWSGHAEPGPATSVLRYAERGIVLVMFVGLGFGLIHMALDLLRSPWRRGG